MMEGTPTPLEFSNNNDADDARVINGHPNFSLNILQQNVRMSRTALEVALSVYNPDVFLVSDIPFCLKKDWSPPGFKLVSPAVDSDQRMCCILIKNGIEYYEIYSQSGRVAAASIILGRKRFGLVSCYIKHTTANGLSDCGDLLDQCLIKQLPSLWGGHECQK